MGDQLMLWRVGLMLAVSLSAWAQPAGTPLGIFEGHGDVGTVLHSGSAGYDPEARVYTVSGSGENMWFAADDFHFVWKKVSGDVTLSADIALLGEGGAAHRKAVLMIRQSLDADSAYADAALHGDGLTSLQFREAKGAATQEIQANVTRPTRLRISKRGDHFYMSVGAGGGEFRPAGGWMKVAMESPFYVGIGLCGHNKEAVEKAVFSNVDLVAIAPDAKEKRETYSTLETVPVPAGDRRAIYVTKGRIEAPSWAPDGAALLFTENGSLRKTPMNGSQAELVQTGPGLQCSRYRGLSPDGKMLAFSARTRERGDLHIYVMPAPDGKPKRITKNAPSRWHGWSPDGKTLVFSGERRGKTGIFTVSAQGGKETVLISGEGVNDNPEYAPDGRSIYFNSNRGGAMQIWRARLDGSGPEQVTPEGMSNWFPHVSPDEKWLAFLSAFADVQGAPRDAEVMLRVMSLSDGRIRTSGKLVGGEGTLEAPCWSPDSRRLAFVGYQFLPAPGSR